MVHFCASIAEAERAWTIAMHGSYSKTGGLVLRPDAFSCAWCKPLGLR